MKESTKKLLTLIAIQNGDIGILARAILELELHREKAMTPTEQDKEQL